MDSGRNMEVSTVVIDLSARGGGRDVVEGPEVHDGPVVVRWLRRRRRRQTEGSMVALPLRRRRPGVVPPRGPKRVGIPRVKWRSSNFSTFDNNGPKVVYLQNSVPPVINDI